ncbi:MAG: MFS transporter [Actinomycetota bacterium]
MAQVVRAGLRGSLRDALPLLAGFSFLMVGHGLTSTLLGIRSALEGFSASVTGIILAGYYLGFLLGSLWAPATIRRVGHIRVFAGLASLASCSVILHIVQAAPATWFLLRALTGLCMSGLYITTETWLNGAATHATRSGLLSSYMVVFTGGTAVGQLLFALSNPAEASAFVIATVLISLAVVPVSLATVYAPYIPDPQPLPFRELLTVAPLAPVAASVAGFTGAAMLGAGAVYGASAGLSQAGTATLIAAALLGGLGLQIPLGRWSDRTDRRRVLFAMSIAGAGAAGAAAALGPGRALMVVVLTFVAGGVAFPLYSVASAHVNDYMESGHVVAAGARMILVNGFGAVAGPVVGATGIQLFGPAALYAILGLNYAAVAAYALFRMRKRQPVPEHERYSHVPLPVGSSTSAAAMVDVYAQELYPVIYGEAPGVDGPIEFREQGYGTAVVLVGDRDQGAEVWDWVLPALAANGLRAIAVQSRSSTQSPGDYQEDLLALLRELDLGSAVFAGNHGGTGAVTQFAVHYYDRVDAAVLVAPSDEESLESLACPVLILEDHLAPEQQPEAFADAIAEFVRHGPTAAARWTI